MIAKDNFRSFIGSDGFGRWDFRSGACAPECNPYSLTLQA